VLADYAISCVIYVGEKKLPRRITACAYCQSTYNLRRYDSLVGYVKGAAEIPGLELRLKPNDPYEKLGGRRNLWHPGDAHGVGSYLLAQFFGTQPVYSPEKKRTYRAVKAQWLETNPERWNNVFLFSDEITSRVGIDLFQGGFFAIASEDFRNGKHVYKVIIDGGLDPLTERFNQLHTAEGEHYFTLGRGRYRFLRNEATNGEAR
jgi:hypothetical protein